MLRCGFMPARQHCVIEVQIALRWLRSWYCDRSWRCLRDDGFCLYRLLTIFTICLNILCFGRLRCLNCL